jgi:uncharacterized protein YhaN
MTSSVSITRICIQGFGCFAEELDLALPTVGVSLILGPNEAGKSTLVTAIKAVLFGLKSADVNDLRPWSSRNEFKGELHLVTIDDDAEKKYIIERNFESNKVIVTDSSNDQPVVLFNDEANPAARQSNQAMSKYRKIIHDSLKFPGEELFTATACVDQLEMETAIDEQMRHLLTGPASADYSSVLNALETEYLELTKENYRPQGRNKNNDRKIEKLTKLLREKEESLSETEQRFFELNKQRDERKELLTSIKDLAERREKAESEYQQFFECFELNKEVDKLSVQNIDLKKALKQIEEKESGLGRSKKSISEIGYNDPPADDFFEKIVQLEKTMGDIKSNGEKVAQLETAPKKIGPRKTVLTVLAVTFLLAGVILGLLTGELLVYVTGIVPGAIFLTLLYIEHRKQNDDRGVEREIIQSRINEDRMAGSKLFDEISPWLNAGRWESVNIDDEKKRYRKYNDCIKETDRLQAVLENLPGKTSLNEDASKVEMELTKNQTVLNRLCAENVALKIFLDDKNNYRTLQEMKTQVQDLLEKHTRAVDEIKTVEATIKAYENSPGERAGGLRNEIEQIERELVACKEQKDALAEALITLHDSITEFQALYKETLAEKIGGQFSIFTGNRYSALKLDDDFVPAASLPEHKDIPPQRLSHGARDQLFLAMRLALAGELWKEKLPPFILDDPFVNFDDDRLTLAMETLQLAAKNRQVILLTHDQRLARFFPEPINLQ